MTEREERYWIDELWEKHECAPYDSTRRLAVKVEDTSYMVIVPPYLPEMEPRVAVRQGELILVIGVILARPMYGEQPDGFVMIARQGTTGDFSAVIWHETYPYAISRLGLSPES
ncbi:MAG: hypothetical protein M3347_01550 [Armatimonadota bacterium]|nr:hypothetical protein [Armatimonadota bacterium]